MRPAQREQRAMADKEWIGIVGIGGMGLSMARHLKRHGYPVGACALTAKQGEAARAGGAAIAASPAEVGKASRFVIIGVGYDDEVLAVMGGDNGLLATMQPGSVVAIS